MKITVSQQHTMKMVTQVAHLKQHERVPSTGAKTISQPQALSGVCNEMYDQARL